MMGRKQITGTAFQHMRRGDGSLETGNVFVRQGEKGFLGSVGQFSERLLRWKEFLIISVQHCCYYKSTILITSIGYLFNESL